MNSRLHLRCLVALAVSFAVIGDVSAAPLDRAACDAKRGERDRLVNAGVKQDMAAGPEAVRALPPARQQAIRTYIETEETLLFRCARFSPKLPKSAVAVKTPRPVVQAGATGKPQPVKAPQVDKKTRQLRALRAKVTAKHVGVVRRVEFSKPGSTSRLHEDAVRADWRERLAAFERGDPLGKSIPKLPRRSPLQNTSRKNRAAPQPAPAGLPDTSLPIKGAVTTTPSKRTAEAKTKPGGPAVKAVPRSPGAGSVARNDTDKKKSDSQQSSLFRGSIFTLSPSKPLDWDPGFGNN